MIHHRMHMRLFCVAALGLLALVVSVRAERVELDKPLPVLAYTTDKTELAGKFIAYTPQAFELRGADGEVRTIAWSDLKPRDVYLLHMRAFGADAEAGAWFKLGKKLLAFEQGEAWSKRAFREALKRDDTLAPAIEQARSEAADAPAESDTPAEPAGDKPDQAATPAAEGDAIAPQRVGEVEAKFWGAMEPAQAAASVEELKKFAKATKQSVNENLKLYETEYFLFYSDLPPAEARNWQGLLDKMYNRLLRMFDIPRGTNIWRGKALVFVFRNQNDYHTFQAVMHRTNSAGSAGMCHSFGSGYVHIAFYRQPDDYKFAHVLVHESVHGFIHRYRSPVPVDSWINEGLAEWIAKELVPSDPRRARMEAQLPANTLRQAGGFRGMFDAPHIAGWQYPLALDVTRFMINNKKQGYIKFFNAIKDGTPWEQAFEEGFGIPFDRFVAGYGQARGIDGLRR